MKKSFELVFVAVIGILFFPQMVSAEVIISEIAWMGTAENSSNEWIELHNMGDETVSLDGWKISTKDGGINETLSGEITSGGYYLLERTDDDSAVGAVADFCYTGSLANGGEILILKNSSGGTAQTLDASAGWPAGDNTTKDTMQWSGSGWVTLSPNPEANDASKVACGEKKEVEKKSGKEKKQGSDKKNSGNNSEASYDGEVSSHNSAVTLTNFDSTPGIVADAGRERIGVPHSSILFFAKAETSDGDPIEKADFSWSFGDGYSANRKKVRHAYQFPGEYNVVLRVEYQDSVAVDRTRVSVRPLGVVITDVESGKEGFVEMMNNGGEETNIGGFVLEVGKRWFAFPDNTIMETSTSIKFPNTLLRLPLDGNVNLVYPSGDLALEYKEGTSKMDEEEREVRGAKISQIEHKLSEAREKLNKLTGLRDKKMESSRQTSGDLSPSEKNDEKLQEKSEKGAERKKEEGKKEEYPALKNISTNVRTDTEPFETIAVVNEPKFWWERFWSFFF